MHPFANPQVLKSISLEITEKWGRIPRQWSLNSLSQASERAKYFYALVSRRKNIQ